MKITIEREFESRKDLDSFVKSRFGENAEANKNITIELDQDSMQRLSLSEKTTINGIKVVKKS